MAMAHVLSLLADRLKHTGNQEDDTGADQLLNSAVRSRRPSTAWKISTV